MIKVTGTRTGNRRSAIIDAQRNSKHTKVHCFVLVAMLSISIWLMSILYIQMNEVGCTFSSTTGTLVGSHNNNRNAAALMMTINRNSYYVPATTEDHLWTNADLYKLKDTDSNPSGCELWGTTITAATRSKYHPGNVAEEKKINGVVVPDHIQILIQQYKFQLREYNSFLQNINFEEKLQEIELTASSNSPQERILRGKRRSNDDVSSSLKKKKKRSIVRDIRYALQHYSRDVVCSAITVPFQNIFNTTKQLSQIQNEYIDNNTGTVIVKERPYHVEPLLTPLRHIEFCDNWIGYSLLMDTSYLIHDYGAICYNSITPFNTRTILIDMGASLLFHGTANPNPVVQLTDSMRNHGGIIFDHIYAYETTSFSKVETTLLFDRIVPDYWQLGYHWMNVGVDPAIDSNRNPLSMIKTHFSRDDFVVVKLDIDTNFIELQLAHQLLNDTELHDLVDIFYFEYHVHMKELAEDWAESMTDQSMYDALKLMKELREKGIMAHFWM